MDTSTCKRTHTDNTSNAQTQIYHTQIYTHLHALNTTGFEKEFHNAFEKHLHFRLKLGFVAHSHLIRARAHTHQTLGQLALTSSDIVINYTCANIHKSFARMHPQTHGQLAKKLGAILLLTTCIRTYTNCLTVS